MNVEVGEVHILADLARESRSGNHLVMSVGYTSLFLIVIIGTMYPRALFGSIALGHLVEVMVVKDLLPTVRVLATVLAITSFSVGLDLFALAPLGAAAVRALVRKDLGLSAEVLPVVSVLALLSVVGFGVVIEGAPDGLEVENVEVSVLFHFVQQIDAQLVLRVGERA